MPDDLTIGIPCYREGSGILPTLESIGCAMAARPGSRVQVLVCDSSPDHKSIAAVEGWERPEGIELQAWHNPERLSTPEALNWLLAAARSEVFVRLDADAIVPETSLWQLVDALTTPEPCDVALGSEAFETSGAGLARRASRWQMTTVHEIAVRQGPTAQRSTSFFAARRRFYADFRFRSDADSFADTVQLAAELATGRWRFRSVPSAVVLKLPPATLREFASNTIRSHAATGGTQRNVREALVALELAAHDPVGAACYGLARLYTATAGRKLRAQSSSAWWVRLDSTKRHP